MDDSMMKFLNQKIEIEIRNRGPKTVTAGEEWVAQIKQQKE